MMVRTAATRGGGAEMGSAALAVATLLLSLAALTRLGASLAPAENLTALLGAAAMLWSAAFLTALGRLLPVQAKRPHGGTGA
jgi:uncharacterized protein involved in response to NO